MEVTKKQLKQMYYDMVVVRYADGKTHAPTVGVSRE